MVGSPILIRPFRHEWCNRLFLCLQIFHQTSILPPLAPYRVFSDFSQQMLTRLGIRLFRGMKFEEVRRMQLLRALERRRCVIRRAQSGAIRPGERIRVTERSDHCGGCQHNCLLKNPGCGVGKDKAARGY